MSRLRAARDERLLEFCATPKQREALEAYWQHGAFDRAAEALGCCKSNVRQQVAAIYQRAARQGYAPEHDHIRTVPDGYMLKGVSTYYNAHGEVAGQWVKTTADRERQAEMMREAYEAFAATLPKVEPLPAPPNLNASTLACYPVGDHHFGMYAWHEEAGSDYDIRIAERLLYGAVDHLSVALPASEQALVVFLGDFMHYDSFAPVTPTSKHQLDSDGRFPLMVRAAIRGMRYTIQSALTRHGRVHVIVEIGNHDLAASIFLMEGLASVYEDEPRVSVDTSPSVFHYYEFGRNLIGVHHGHGVKKITDLPLIMASDRPESWGRTAHRHWWTGHIHQQQVHDVQGCKVESFRVLPPADAWAHGQGYRSARSMTGIVHHVEHGEVARYSVNPAMLEAA